MQLIWENSDVKGTYDGMGECIIETKKMGREMRVVSEPVTCGKQISYHRNSLLSNAWMLELFYRRLRWLIVACHESTLEMISIESDPFVYVVELRDV